MNVLLTMYDIHWIIQLDILDRREAGTGGSIDIRAARSSDTDLKWLRSLGVLSLLHRKVWSDCNAVQYLAMAIREASVMLVYGIFNPFSPVHWVDIDMMLASDILLQSLRFNAWSAIQWKDIDMILTSVIWVHHPRSNDCSPVQWVDIDMMLTSVK